MTAGFTVSAGWDVPAGDQSEVHAAVAMAGAAAAHARLVPAERAAAAPATPATPAGARS
jgi:hypothetical protein